jgi:hypothetical protein
MVQNEAFAAQGIDTLFRANTIGTKALDMFMKLVAKQWLYDAIYPTVRQIYKEKKSFEVDALKLDKGEDAKRNFKALTETISELLERIYATKDEIPKYAIHLECFLLRPSLRLPPFFADSPVLSGIFSTISWRKFRSASPSSLRHAT